MVDHLVRHEARLWIGIHEAENEIHEAENEIHCRFAQVSHGTQV